MEESLKESLSKKRPTNKEEEPKEGKVDQSITEVVKVNEDVHSKLEDRKTRLLEKEAARKIFEKQALIFPEELMNEDKKEDIAPITMVETVLSPPHVPAAEKVPQESTQLTPDMLGLYTLTLPVKLGSDLDFLSSLQEDIAWFDTPVNLLTMEMAGDVGGAMIEVKLGDNDMAMAILNGLKHKYPGLEGDFLGTHADILPSKETGLYTLCFTDTKRKRYKATMDKFKMYSKQVPVICKGLGAEQVLVGFHAKEDAVEAFRQNLESEEFPELHVATVSRS